MIYLTQNFFHKNQCTISLNSDYMVIFKNPRDNSQFVTIARQIRPDKVKFPMWAYKDATSSPHAYLMLDLKPDTEGRFQLRSNILEDPQHVYVTCIDSFIAGKAFIFTIVRSFVSSYSLQVEFLSL